MMAVATEPRVVLPVLTWITEAVHRVWLPNPLTMRVMELYSRRGYEQAAARAKAGM
jgi:hypothetical protein